MQELEIHIRKHTYSLGVTFFFNNQFNQLFFLYFQGHVKGREASEYLNILNKTGSSPRGDIQKEWVCS